MRALHPVTISLALLSAPALTQAQDVWSAPAPGLRTLRRSSEGRRLHVVFADLREEQLRLAARPLGATPLALREAVEECDAYVALGLRGGAEFITEINRMLGDQATPVGSRLVSDEGAPLWAAVGLTAARRLVILAGDGRAIAPAMVDETLRSAGVVRAVSLRGSRAPSLVVRGEGLSGGPGPVDAMLSLRLLPGATRFAGEPRTLEVGGVAASGGALTLSLRAINTGRAAWRAGASPRAIVDAAGDAVALSLLEEAGPGQTARFAGQWTPRRAGAYQVSARLVLDEQNAVSERSIERLVRVREAREARVERRVETAGFAFAADGPSGLAWLVLSVFGSVSAALSRRARSAA